MTGIVEFNSIRLNPVESFTLDEGKWVASVTMSYFNQFILTWHTMRGHQDRDLERLVRTLDELRFIEREFSNDEVYHIDVEGWRGDLIFSYGLPKGLILTTQISYIALGGGPQMDSLAESFQELFTSWTFGRDLIPKGENTIWLRSGRRTFEDFDPIDSGLSDITLSVAMPVGGPEKEQSVVFAVQPPTGTEETFRGSGGWDLGVR